MYRLLEVVILIVMPKIVIPAIILSLIMWIVNLFIGKNNKIKSIYKKIIKWVSIITIILVMISLCLYLLYQFGWRLFGFDACEGCKLESVVQDGDTLIFNINTGYSMHVPSGEYVYKVKGDVLEIGFHMKSIYLGKIYRKPTITLKLDEADSINKIVLKCLPDKGIDFIKQNGEWKREWESETKND